MCNVYGMYYGWSKSLNPWAPLPFKGHTIPVPRALLTRGQRARQGALAKSKLDTIKTRY